MVGQVPPPVGGVTEQVRLLIHSKLKEKVHLAHLSPGRSDGCRGPRRIFNSIALVLRVAWRCLAQRPDVAHLHTSSHLGFYEKALLAALLRLFRARVVLHLHGGGFAEFHERSRCRWLLRSTLERADAVLALSGAWRQYLLSIAPRARVEVFRNSIDLPRQNPVNKEIVASPPRVVFLGSLVRAKGVFKLIEIARHFAAGEAVFEIVGDGPEAARLADAIRASGLQDRIQMRGALHGAEKTECLRNAAVFLLPSDFEGQPVSILEAMAARAAVVASDVGGIPELLDGGRGFACPCNDPGAMAGAIHRLLRDDTLRRETVGRAFAYVSEVHDLSRQVDQLIGIYRHVIFQNPAHGPVDRPDRPVCGYPAGGSP